MKVGDKIMCHNGLYPYFFMDNYYVIEHMAYDNIHIDGVIFNYEFGSFPKFKNHFYTPTELRKIKLDKLNGREIKWSGLF